ncbi:helix-turn-helix transcriptional regulator [Sulfurovum sp. CS9]|uniref:helix-turn-helix transcriptional regulator n=1 Tax=Sulfurovum sp. CS9 TaxID=3391146 RepID=UPI0039EB203A
METKTTPQNRFMTPKQLEAEYSFSEANQAQMRMKKRIPYIKIGGYVKYDRQAIDKWLEQNAVQVTA